MIQSWYMSAPTISAVVLMHDDAPSVADTIRSLGWCDEILVIEDADHPVQRRGAFPNVRVLRRALCGDFAAQRNFGLAEAKGPWVLFVDSDETIRPDLAEEIRMAVQKYDVRGFFLKREDVMWSRALRHGETDRVRLLRLAQKDAGVWRRPVHEVWEVHGAVATLTHSIRHIPHPDVAHFLSDVDRYSTINAQYLFQNGAKATVFHIVCYPVAKFLQNYVLRRGFLDGMPGMIMAVMMSLHSFLTRAKLWQLTATR